MNSYNAISPTEEVLQRITKAEKPIYGAHSRFGRKAGFIAAAVIGGFILLVLIAGVLGSTTKKTRFEETTTVDPWGNSQTQRKTWPFGR